MKVCRVDESGNTAQDTLLAFEATGAAAAMHRAALRARRRAAANGTPIAVFEDGKVVWMRVNEHDAGRRRAS